MKFTSKISLIALVVGALFSGNVALAQDLSRNQVPSVVVNEFQKRFPKALDIDWEYKKGAYQVEFEIDRLDHEVWFDREGQILKHKEEIRIKSLPEQVRTKVRERFKNFRITDAERLTKGKSVVYKLEIHNLLQEIDL